MITTDGAVVQNLDVRGGIEVRADDVTIRNVSFHIDPSWSAASTPNFVVQTAGHSGLTVIDSRFDGSDATGRPVVYDAIADYSAKALTMRRNDVTGVCNGIESGNDSLVEGNFVHELWQYPDSGCHADGIQFDGGSDIVVQDNYVRMGVPPAGTWSQTSAIGIWADLGPLRNVTVRSNVIDVGAGYLFYAGATNGTGFSVTDCSFVGNVVLRDRWHAYGVWYPGEVRCSRSGTVTDDGRPVSDSA